MTAVFRDLSTDVLSCNPLSEDSLSTEIGLTPETSALKSLYGGQISLRTAPTIVTAHTFYASPDTRVSFGYRSLIQVGIFLHGLKIYGESRTVSKCSWYAKRKLGETMHFSEII